MFSTADTAHYSDPHVVLHCDYFDLSSESDYVYTENHLGIYGNLSGEMTMGITHSIRLSAIGANPNQPRQSFPRKELNALARSLDEHGLLQPVIVRRTPSQDTYELIAGERRLRAARQLGWQKIAAMVITATDKQSAEMALIENVVRQDLSPLEEGQALKTLLDGGETYRGLAQKIGKDKGYIENRVRLLTMPEEIQELVRCKPGMIFHSYELAKLENTKLRGYYIRRLMDDKHSRLTLSQMRHELRYALKDERPNNDHMYALWNYDYLRDPSDGDETYQGNCQPSVVKGCLECLSRKTARYKKKGFTLWIPFAGSGTGIETAKRMGVQNIIASDINPTRRGIRKLDALNSGLPANSVDAIFAHPPYWDAVKYTKLYADGPDPCDTSLARDLPSYLDAMDRFCAEAKRVLKRHGYLFVMIGDIRRKNQLIPLTAHLALIGSNHLELTQRVTKIRKRSSRLMPALMSNAKRRGHLIDITDTILFFRKSGNSAANGC